ncbi:flavodoxin family protein [Candidatus Woesearchaeota archaeon]|nr:flavodoxin family protein [Candidatus Woesearchaeota archaeon]
MVKILAICGSPRKGNTEFMLTTLLKAAAEKGAETEMILLRKYNIKPCTGCDICFGTQMPCKIKDDMDDIYNDLQEADVIVLGSPNYFKNVSSIMKAFMDRTNAIVNPPKLKGKKAAIVCVGGQTLDNTKYCENVMKEFIEDHEMKFIGSVLARAESPGDLNNNKMIIKKLRELGEKIAK